MKTRITMLSAALAVVLLCSLGAPAAYADSTPISLTNWDIRQFKNDGDSVAVYINSADKKVSVIWKELPGNPTQPTFVAIDYVYFGKGNDHKAKGVGGITPFGRFAYKVGKSGLDKCGDTCVEFVLSDEQYANLTSNPADFAVHVKYTWDCAGLVSNRSASNTENDSGCTSRISTPYQGSSEPAWVSAQNGAVSTPEPTSLVLLGPGLLFLGLVRRRLSRG
jgi:hypothetical protein